MATPTCPDKRHRNSTVVRAGWYGREGQRRQRWWCQPKTGERHRFTETLPRITSGDGQPHACAQCQTTLEAWEGQPAPRLYGFTARDVAWALVQAAQGASYRGTAAAVRARAGRELDTERGLDAKGRPRLAPANQHGQIVSDWVDVFAPVIWKAYAPTSWPEAVMVDEDTLKYAVPFKANGLVAFYVLGAMGRDTRGRQVVVALEAFPRLNADAWDRFLHRLDGHPSWVVTDGGRSVTGATSKAWPDAQKWRCEWHLRRNLEEKLPAHVRADRSHPVHGKLTDAQLSGPNWQEYVDAVAEHHRAEPGWFAESNRVTALDALIRRQATTRPADVDRRPLSTGPLEQFFRTLDNTIGDRAARMTNKRRADALLKLMAAHRNGWVNHDRWTEVIRAHLDAHRGRAADQRRHTDPRSAPSLR